MGRALDLSGQRFGRLVAVSKADGRWLCHCDCGGTKQILTRHLQSGRTRSCGCITIERLRSMPDVHLLGRKARNATRHQGTIVCAIKSSKPYCNSTTGVRGVALHHSGRYRAYLYLRKRQINLGFFDTLEEATLARKAGEEKYFAPVIASFYQEIAGKKS
jgi:hypothetical protein